MADNTESKKGIFKKWLETLQQESWQLELLISGLALFGVFEAKGLIDSLDSFLHIQFFSRELNVGIAIFLFLLRGSWYIFLINLMIHIVLRGLWIGAIGLRYVSEDIDYEKLNFSSYFHKLYTRRYKSFDDYIEDLEKICSVIFAYTFLLFFILISACMFLLWPNVFMTLGNPFIVGFAVMFYLIFGLIVFVDFIFLNPLKKVKDRWFGKVYGFIFRFFSTITLSFIFRPLLLNFLDNKFTKRLFLFSIPYGILIIILVPNVKGESFHFFPDLERADRSGRAYQSQSFSPYLYDDTMPEGKKRIYFASLSQQKYTGSVIDFFLVHFSPDEIYFEDVLGISPLKKKGIFTGFKNTSLKDSSFVELEEQHSQELKRFFEDKAKRRDAFTDSEWNEKVNEIQTRQNFAKTEWHRSKAQQINEAFKGMCTFYIDDIEMTDQVDCLLSQHENAGEKGWKCIAAIDSIPNGLHRLKVVRNVFNLNNKVLSPRIIEIPFILDKS